MRGVERIRAISEAWRLRDEEGLGPSEIARRLGRGRATVASWLAEENNPYVDQVAVERALRGERQVFDTLSAAEKVALMQVMFGISPRTKDWNYQAKQWGIDPDIIRKVFAQLSQEPAE